MASWAERHARTGADAWHDLASTDVRPGGADARHGGAARRPGLISSPGGGTVGRAHDGDGATCNGTDPASTARIHLPGRGSGSGSPSAMNQGRA